MIKEIDHNKLRAILPKQNKMSDKCKRIQGGNEMVISTVLKLVFVLCFGYFILSW